jgi:hypothetical protein
MIEENTEHKKPATLGGQIEPVVSVRTLHLHLKYEYFDAIKSGEKAEEFRDINLWKKRLDKHEYKFIRLYRGYQKVSPETVIDLPYKGYKHKTITHPHFQNRQTVVCAIDVAH